MSGNMKDVFDVFSSLFSPDEPQSALAAFPSALRQRVDKFLSPGKQCNAALREDISVLTKLCHSDRDLFVSLCVLLLQRLCNAMLELRTQSSTISSRHRHRQPAPPPPPDSLSVSQQNLLCSAFQSIIALGVCPFLQLGVGQPIALRCPGSSGLLDKMIRDGEGEYCVGRLANLIGQLLECQRHPALKCVLLSKHLGDLLCGLLQICYGTCTIKESHSCISDSQKANCEDILDSVLNQTYQPSIIREIVLLQGAGKSSAPLTAQKSSSLASPVWLRRACGKLLSQRLLQKNGLQALTTALFDMSAGGNAEDAFIKIPKMIASLVACLPKQESHSSYYGNICKQLVDVLSSDKALNQGLHKTSVSVLFALCEKEKVAVKTFVVQPMIDCFIDFLKSGDNPMKLNAAAGSGVLQSMHFLHKVFISYGHAHYPSVGCFSSVIPPLFRMTSLCGHGHFRCLSIEFLQCFFRAADEKSSLRILLESAIPRCSSLSSQYAQKKLGKLEIASSADGTLRDYQAEVECILEVVLDTKLLSDFLLVILEEINAILPSVSESRDAGSDDEQSSSYHYFLLVGLASAVYESHGTQVLLDVKMLLGIVESSLDEMVKLQHWRTQQGSTVKLPLGLLSGLLSIAEEEVRFCGRRDTIADLLASVSQFYTDDSVCRIAENLRIGLLIGSEMTIERLAESKPSRNETPFQQAKDLLSNCLLPIQVQGIHQITRLIESKDAECLENFSVVQKIMLECMSHSDSYVYLAAINGFVAMGSVRPDDVLPFLCKEFGSWSGCHVSEVRAKVGEAIVKLSGKLGETLVKYKDDILSAFLTAAKEESELVRSSSLSSLATVCQLLHYSLGSCMQEVAECLVATGLSDTFPQVRQAAVFAIKSILKGLGSPATKVAGGEILKKFYHCLKTIESEDRDLLTRTHAQAALGELSTIMKNFLFPLEHRVKTISILGQLS